MTTTTTEGREFTQAEIIPMLAGIQALKARKRELDDAITAAEQPVRDWLTAHPEDVLRDGEHGLTARFQERRGPLELDIVSLRRNDPEMLLTLAERGLLKLNNPALQGQSEQGIEMVELKRIAYRAKGTSALVIERDR